MKINSGVLIVLLLCGAFFHPMVSVLESAAQPAREIQPNILWILAEDMGPELGVYGTPEVRSPHLDRLASNGMRFDNAFTTAPVCSPSRSAFNTGMYQMTIGAHNHRSHRQGDYSAYPHPLPDGVQILSDWLRQAGYFTGNIRELPKELGFRGTGKTDWNFTYEGKPFDTERWDDLQSNQPFFAQINLPETHRGEEWNTAHELIGRPADPAKVVFPPYYPDHPVTRADWAQYLNSVMSLDRKIGALLELLEKSGLSENTIVIFMGDNGRAMVRGKQWPYDSGLHVPLMIYIPPRLTPVEGYRAGTISDQLISAIDVTATILAVAGIKKPQKMQGKVFMGSTAEAPRDYVFGGRDRGDETVDRIRTVRSRRYRYLRNYYPERPFLQLNRYKETNYPILLVLRKLHQEGKLSPEQERLMAPKRPSEELYDLQNDPFEVNNLVDSPEHRRVLDEMRETLDHWLVEIDDQGRIPEDPAVWLYYEQRSKGQYDERMQRLWKEWGLIQP